MNTSEILSAIDAEISRLSAARSLLSDIDNAGVAQKRRSGPSDETTRIDTPASPPSKRRGRPKGSKNKATSFNPADFAPKRRSSTVGRRARVVDAPRAQMAEPKEDSPQTPRKSSNGRKTAAEAAIKRNSSPAKRTRSRTPSTPASTKTSTSAARKNSAKAPHPRKSRGTASGVTPAAPKRTRHGKAAPARERSTKKVTQAPAVLTPSSTTSPSNPETSASR